MARNGDEEKRLVKLASAGDLRAIELRDVDEWSDVAGDKGESDDVEDVAPKEVLFTPETTRAVACYAVLAAIAIGYDEMLPVFLKTSHELGGCEFAPRDIGILLVCGGVTLLVFQLVLYPRIADALGAVRAFRFGVALFAAVSMLAPFASVMPNEPMLWTVALVSQCTKICALGIGFVSITIVVNNSCEDAVKARVNGIAGTTSAFARIVAPVICGWTFAGAMRFDFSGAAIPSIRLHLRRHGRASRHRRTPADGAGQPHIVRRRRRYSSIRRPRARRARRIKFRFALLVT